MYALEARMPGELPQAKPQAAAPRKGRWVTVLIVSVGLLALAGFWLLKITTGASLRLRTCFQNVSGLRSGAKVRLAGVDIGIVGDVRAQPTNKTCRAAVEMEVRTPYELTIPQDSVVSTATAGLLGETYLEIDASGTSGPPAHSGDQLPSKESANVTAETVDRALKAVDGMLKQLSDEVKDGKTPPTNATPTKTK
jgi:phospholipid/cholesterol/gamma-HCH transport system substrate-binding protein